MPVSGILPIWLMIDVSNRGLQPHTISPLQHIEHHRTILQKKKPENTTKMSFEPKTKIELDPPKDDIISLDYLSKCDGTLFWIARCG
jgi:hypothetical protein